MTRSASLLVAAASAAIVVVATAMSVPPTPRHPRSWEVFQDVSAAVGLTAAAGLKYGGPVVADLNRDGVYDLVLPQHNLDPTLVYYGRPNGTYARAPDLFPFLYDIHGVAAGDVDLDGDLDLLVTLGGAFGVRPQPPVFLRNTNGTGYRVDTEAAGLAAMGGRGRSPRFVDLDRDGDLDLILFHYVVLSGPGPRQQVYENVGGGKYVFRPGSGLDDTIGEQLVLTDMDNDRRADVVSFPFFRLYRQVSPFQFVDETIARLGHIPFFVERLAPAFAVVEFDMDNDGFFDLYVVRGAAPDVLLRNTGTGRYDDVTATAGLTDACHSTGVTAGDFDNDGNVDVMVFCGGPTGRRETDVLLYNLGDGTFHTSTTHGAVADAANGRGDAGQAFDYDGDGRLDVLVGNGDRDDAAAAGTWALYRNILPACVPGRHYLTVRVRRNWPRTSAAAGALVTVRVGNTTRSRRVGSAGGANHQSQLDIVHFGVGDATVADEVRVFWSDGSFSPVRRNVAVDQRISFGR